MFVEKIITKLGYIETTIPHVYFNQLVQNINNNPPTEPFNQKLVGQIENEKYLDLSLIPEEVKNIIFKGCEKYLYTFGHDKPREPNQKWSLQLEGSWINFQKAGEYNPIHNHSGDLVYVTWLKIPYDLEKEYNHSSSKNSYSNISSKFQFSIGMPWYTNEVNDVLHIDKTYEGKMIIFHARLSHCVYPFFTSDDYRISMSGNLNIVFDA